MSESSRDVGNRQLPSIPLPRTTEEMIARRVFTRRRTLNDFVEDIHLELWEVSKEYMDYLDAVYDAEAVEGSRAADDLKAAECIRSYARKNDIGEVAGKKLATLVKALNVVLAKYGATRRQRAKTLRGEIVPEANDTASD